MERADPRITAFAYRRQALDGSARDPLDVLARVVGVYSAMPTGPLSIRARMPGVGPDDVRALELDRAAVRMRAMRTSAFLVPVDTASLVAAATAVPMGRFGWLLRAAGIEEGSLAGVRARVVAAAPVPVTPTELRARLAAAGVEGANAPWTEGAALGRVLSLLTASGDLVAVGGTSLSSNSLRYVDRRAWLGGGPGLAPETASPVDPGKARAWLAGEYLRGFGPARVADVAWWAGWARTTAEEALAAHDTVDAGDGLLLHARDMRAFETAEPLGDEIRLVPKWDAWTMGYPLDGRSRFLDRDVHDRVFDGDGNGLAMVLRGGRAIGAWSHRGERGALRVALDLFEPATGRLRTTIEDELGAVATFLGYGSVVVHDVASVIPERPRIRRPLDRRSP